MHEGTTTTAVSGKNKIVSMCIFEQILNQKKPNIFLSFWFAVSYKIIYIIGFVILLVKNKLTMKLQYMFETETRIVCPWFWFSIVLSYERKYYLGQQLINSDLFVYIRTGFPNQCPHLYNNKGAQCVQKF